MMLQPVEITKCEMCNSNNTLGYKEGVTENFGLGTSHSTKEFCEKCFNANTFENSYGFVFLKYKDRLFCYKPYHYLDFGFREVLSEKDIDRAFNPERYEFEKWLRNR